MHLNILLNRINWRRLAEHALCFWVFLMICSTAAYAEEAQVIIETGAMTYFDTGFAVDVTVTFKDTSLYNEQVYLSYHVVDENGECLIYENQRLPFYPDAAFTTVYVEWTSIEAIADRSTAVIQFDLVDEANVYWFSENSDIIFQTASVVFDRETLLPGALPVSENNEEKASDTSNISTLFSAAINAAIWIAILFLIYLFAQIRDQKLKRKGKTKSMKLPQDENSVLKWIGLIFVCAFSVFIVRTSQVWFTSDNLAMDVIVQQYLTSGSILLRNYVSQQTFWIFNILAWLPRLLLNLLIPDVITAAKICVVLFYLIFISLVYLVTKNVSDSGSAWVAICFLGCGLSASWLISTYMEAVYALHQVYMLVFLLLCYRIYESHQKEGRRSTYSVKKYLLLILFITYITSFDQRYTAIFVLPFCAAVVIAGYEECYKERSLLQAIKKPATINAIFFLTALVIGTVIGLGLNEFFKLHLPFSARLTELEQFTFADFSGIFDALAIHISGILNLWGCEFNQSISTVSITSFFYLIKGAVCFVCMIFIPLKCAVNYNHLEKKMKVLILFYFIMLAELFYIYVFSSLNTCSNSRYFVYCVTISIIISSWYLYEYAIKPHNLNRYLLIAGLIVFGLISQISIQNHAKDAVPVYEIKQDAISFLEDRDLVYGYATYWNAQVLTSMSNTQVKILPVIVTETVIPFYDINYIQQFSSENYTGPSFIMLDSTEYQDFMERVAERVFQECGEPVQIMERGAYTILLWDYNIAQNLFYFPYNEGYIPVSGSH